MSAGGMGAHPPGLVALWSGEGDGNDSIGENNMVLTGVSFMEGKVGQAFGFNGINQWASCEHNSIGNFGANDFTVMFWVKFNALGNEQIMVEKFIEPLNGSPIGWTITKLSNNRFRFAETGGFAPVVDYGAAVIDTWIHMAVTRSNGLVACYVNGFLSGQLATMANLDSTATLKFGHRGNPMDTPGSADNREMYLNGALDEIAIYNRALSAEEIKSIGIIENNGEPLPPPAVSPMPFNRIHYRNGSANGFSE
ncbi:MAG TPA: LamG domain-containing protein [Verrucomicrobiae bacterium]